MFTLHKKGFTIIEVALVLAVAGMIMLAVFLALPAVQRTERDSERQEDLAEIINAIKDYQSNNRGALPGTEVGQWQTFYGKYLPNLTEPNGQKYFDNLQVITCESATSTPCSGASNGAPISTFMNKDFDGNNYGMIVVIKATCDGNNPVGSANGRKVALLYTLEAGGTICKNS